MNIPKRLDTDPDVSFSGSPTVSPMTAASWALLPLPHFLCPPGVPRSSMYFVNSPFSTHFLALSQAPPVLDWEMAICTPDVMPPASNPVTACTPNKYPAAMGPNTSKYYTFPFLCIPKYYWDAEQ